MNGFDPNFTITNRMTAASTQIERARGFLEAARFSDDWVREMADRVLVSGIAQFQLVHIHPFLDGNGHTSRLLSTLCLYKIGYDFKRLFTISEYYDRDCPAFYKAIQNGRENDMNLTGWLDYFVIGLEAQMIEVKQRGEMVIRRDMLVQKYRLNDRQGKALGHLIALPLQKQPRERGFSVFVDKSYIPYPDQWAFLASITPMSRFELENAILQATRGRHPLDVAFVAEENEHKPWKRSTPVSN